MIQHSIVKISDSTTLNEYYISDTGTYSFASTIVYLPKIRPICRSCKDYLTKSKLCFKCTSFKPIILPLKSIWIQPTTHTTNTLRSGNKHHSYFPKQKFK